MIKTTIKTAFIGGLITGVTGCAALKADLEARDGVHVETPGQGSKLAEINLEDLINLRLDKLEKMIDFNANVVAKAIDMSKRNQTQQQVAASQPVTAGRDAKNISPNINISGDNSPYVVLGGAAMLLFVVGKWLKGRRVTRTMIRAIEQSEGSEQVRQDIAKAAYKAGVSQEVYNHLQKVKKNLKAEQTRDNSSSKGLLGRIKTSFTKGK